MGIREIKKMCEDVGVTIVNIKQNGHFIVRARNSAGTEKVFTFSFSASDHRAELNQRALLRRFAKAPPP